MTLGNVLDGKGGKGERLASLLICIGSWVTGMDMGGLYVWSSDDKASFRDSRRFGIWSMSARSWPLI